MCGLASAGALVAAGRRWASGTVPALPPLPAQELAVTGAQAGTPVRGLAVVGLAGAVAVLAARGWLRPLVGVLLTLAGLGIALAALTFDPAPALAAVRPGGGPVPEVARTAWPLLTAACGAALTCAGALVAVRGRHWSTLSRRYDSPSSGAVPTGTSAATGPPGERELWEALDRGEDPTEGADGTSNAPPTDPGQAPPAAPTRSPGPAPR